jgi:hypothetical protein
MVKRQKKTKRRKRQKDKQWSSKRYTENHENPHKNGVNLGVPELHRKS